MLEQILQFNYQELGAIGMLILILFFVVRSVIKTNRYLINQNQANIKDFLNELNHNQTLNREALKANTDALGKMSEINDRLLNLLKKNGN